MREEHFLKRIIEYFNQSWKVFAAFLGLAIFAAGFNIASHPMFTANGTIVINQSDSSPLQAITARVSGLQMNSSQAIDRYMLYFESLELYREVAKELYKRNDIISIRRHVNSGITTLFNRELFAKVFTGSINLDDFKRPDPNDVEAFARDIRAVTTAFSKGRNIIQFTARTGSAKSSVAVVNALVDTAVKGISGHDLKEVLEAKGFLESQLLDVGRRIDHIEKDIVRQKKKSSAVASVEDMEDQLGAQSLNIQNDLVEYKLKIKHNNELIKKLESMGPLDNDAYQSQREASNAGVAAAKFSRASRLYRLKKENEIYKSRMDVLRPLAERFVKRQKNMPRLQQNLLANSKRLELEYQYYAELKRQILQLEMQQMSMKNRISNVNKATPSRTVPFMSPVAQFGTAIMIALTFSGLWCFLLEAVHPHIFNRKDLEGMGANYFGAINDYSTLLFWKRLRRVFDRHFQEEDVEAPFNVNLNGPESTCFRYLRSRLLHSHTGKSKKRVKVIAVVSPVAEEGKSFIAYNLSKMVGLAKKKTVIVDCDFRKGSLTKALPGEKRTGLSDYLVDNSLDLKAMTNNISDNLDFISIGESLEDAINHIPEQGLVRFINLLRSQYDMVILDTPAVLPAVDALEIAKHVDMVVMSVLYGRTRVDLALRTIERLKHATKAPIGFVMNRHAFESDVDYGYYYHNVGPDISKSA